MTNKDQFFKITLIVAIILLSILIYLVIMVNLKPSQLLIMQFI